MIDTLNMRLDRVDMSIDPFDILPYLANITERQSEGFGYSASGNLGDYTIHINQCGITLKGSLAKFFLPSNVYTLDRSGVEDAILMMSEQLHTDISLSKVTRVDISTVIPTQRPPTDYYSSLGLKPHFERVQATKNTLYYNSSQRQMVFYDKTKEAIYKNAIIPPTFTDKNLFRYELRYTKNIRQQLKLSNPLLVADIYNPMMYHSLIQHWRDEFHTIKKINTTKSMNDNIKTPKDAKDVLFAMLLQGAGQQVIEDFIADLKAANTYDDPKYYSRLKADLNRIMATPSQSKSELVAELEAAIDEIARYSR